MAGENPPYDPLCVVVVSGVEIPGDRLLSAEVVLQTGSEADRAVVRLDNRDRLIESAAIGQDQFDVVMGYRNAGMVMVGRFRTDEVTFDGPPWKVTIRGRADDTPDRLKQRRTKSWRDTTIGGVVSVIAGDYGLDPVVSPDLAGRPVRHIDQMRESDMHFLSRLADAHDANAKVAEGKLVFLDKETATGATGGGGPEFTVTPQECSRWSARLQSRPAYKAVVASYHVPEKGESKTVAQPGPGEPALTLDETFADEGAARTAAASKHKELQRAKGEVTVEVWGQPEIPAESRMVMQGFLADVDGTWWVRRVRHAYTGSGLSTEITAEAPST